MSEYFDYEGMKLPEILGSAEFEYKSITSDRLVVNPKIQRRLSKAKIKQIIDTFNPYKLNALKVSCRNGRYYLFDGQHTLAALHVLNNEKPLPVACKVFYGLTEEQEAWLFAHQADGSTPVSKSAGLAVLQNFNDPEAMDIINAAKEVGVEIDFVDKSKKPRKVSALINAVSCYRNMGEVEFREMLDILNRAWGEYEETFAVKILTAMAFFVEHFYGQYDKDYLVASLRTVEPTYVIRAASGEKSGKLAMAKRILELYNKKKRTNRLPDNI